MRTLKEARTQRNITLQQLSEHCAIDRRRISAFEHLTRFPTVDEQRKLDRAFGEELYWSEKRDPERAPKEIRKLFHRKFQPGWKPHVPPSVRLLAARSDNRELYDALYAEVPKESRWFLHYNPLDSQLEAFIYLWLLKSKWNPFIDSPQAFCFRKMAIVDPKSREHCANRRVPLLLLDQREFQIVLFPQTHLRPIKRIWRVDALGCINRGKQREWFVLEGDGKLHSYSEDDEKEREIALPFLRFKTDGIMSESFPTKLMERARSLLALQSLRAA